ncbi:hypothetical protein [Streptomyces sp. NPDC008121]|uniref:hypothetical protein n=1 Tax=Streptomyces sp. NPDC008121 TaxID=3364809 RepID=UPI0036E02A6F
MPKTISGHSLRPAPGGGRCRRQWLRGLPLLAAAAGALLAPAAAHADSSDTAAAASVPSRLAFTSADITVPESLQEGGVSAVAVSGSVVLAVKDGNVVKVRGWGSVDVPQDLQSGGGVTALALGGPGLAVKDGNVRQFGPAPEDWCPKEYRADMPAVLASGGGTTAVESNSSLQAAFAVKDGRLYQWGCSIDLMAVPAELSTGGVTEVKTMGASALAVKDGNVHAWGHAPRVPAELSQGGGVTSIALSNNGRTGLAVKDGSVHSWGEYIGLPPGLRDDGHVTSVSADSNGLTVAAVKDDGTLISSQDPGAEFHNRGITSATAVTGGAFVIQKTQTDMTLKSKDGYLITRPATERDYLGFGQSDAPQDAKTFSVVLLKNNEVALKSKLNGKYVMVDQTTNGPAGPNYHLRAAADSIGPWEKFTLHKTGGGSVLLKSVSTGRYVQNSSGTLNGHGTESQAAAFDLAATP